jgi:preprotein translocase subunit SecB
MEENKDQNTEHSSEAMPHISVNAQYIKDLSFENPNAPQSLASLKEAPKINLSLDLNVTRLQEEGSFEVALSIEASGSNSKFEKLFVVELVYAGVFTLQNIPEDQHQILLAVHCPAMIFPFARKIIADVTQDGGFQPLMIDPIDFGMLYHKRLLEESQSQGNA